MELALNVVWACVAVAGILAQIVTLWRAAPANRPVCLCQKIIAMNCALVILFFVISMTDDLHDLTLVIEERRIARVVVGEDIPAHPTSTRSVPIDFLVDVPPVVLRPPLAVERKLVERSESLFTAAMEGESLSDRAPPNSFL